MSMNAACHPSFASVVQVKIIASKDTDGELVSTFVFYLHWDWLSVIHVYTMTWYWFTFFSFYIVGRFALFSYSDSSFENIGAVKHPLNFVYFSHIWRRCSLLMIKCIWHYFNIYCVWPLHDQITVFAFIYFKFACYFSLVSML